jgi:MFS transporter, FSR family, fosmidomycin resistance protein
MTTLPTHFLRERDYLSVSLNHFFIDVLNSGRNLLVAILAIALGLSNAQVGIVLLLYNVGSALMQPLFGWLADRIGARWLVVGGMGWSIFFYGLSAVASDWVALMAVTVAGIGSGAFHPPGTMIASQVSQKYRNRATALFFTSGQLGLFMGPVFTGILLELYGRPGYLVLPALAFVAFLSAWQWVVDKPAYQAARLASRQAAATARNGLRSPTALLLSLIIINISTVSIAAMTFAPKLFTEMGYTPNYVGWLSGLFMLGAAVGGVVGGLLADRFNGRSVIMLGVLASVLPLYFYIPLPGAWRFGLLFLAGFFNGMPHAILVLMVQSLLPNRRGTGSGLALGFMFFSGAVGSYFLGLIADQVGLDVALQGTAVLPLIALLAALLLPRQN